MTQVKKHLNADFFVTVPTSDLFIPQHLKFRSSRRDNELNCDVSHKKDVVNVSVVDSYVIPSTQTNVGFSTNNQLQERYTLNNNFLVTSFNQHLKSLLDKHNYVQSGNEAINEERLSKILRPQTPPPDYAHPNANLQPHSTKTANLNAELPHTKEFVLTNTSPTFTKQEPNSNVTTPPLTPKLNLTSISSSNKKTSQPINYDSDEDDFPQDYDNQNSIFSAPFDSNSLQQYSHVRACSPRELMLDTKLTEKYQECWPDGERIINSKMPYRDLYKEPWIENIFPLFVLLVTSRRKGLVSVFRSFFDFLMIKVPARSPREIRRAINGKLKRLVFVYPHLQYYSRTGFTLKNLRSVPEVLLVIRSPFLKEKFQESVGIRCYKDVKLYSTLGNELMNFQDEPEDEKEKMPFDRTFLCDSWNKKGGLWGLDSDFFWRA